jgi:hypothetical protein
MTELIAAFCNFANAPKDVGGIGGVAVRVFDFGNMWTKAIACSANLIGVLMDCRADLDILEKRLKLCHW